MFAPRVEATPVPAKGSKIRPSELRWLFHQLPTAGIPSANRPRPAPRSITVIDLTGDESDSENRSRRVNSRYDKIIHSDDDRHLSPPQTSSSSSRSSSHFASLPFRQRKVLNQSPIYPEGSRRQTSDRRIPHDSQNMSRLPTTNKRKELESGKDDEQPETWSVKRMRPRRVLQSVEVGPDGGTIFIRDSEDESMESAEGESQDSDEDENEGKDYDVERVIAEKRGRRVHEYLLAWVGYKELSWVRAEDCNCDELIAEFRAVPQVGVVAESVTAREIEEGRVRRSESAAKTRVSRRKVKSPGTQGAGSSRNPKIGRFQRARVDEDQSESEWEVIQSDKELNAQPLRIDNNCLRDAWEVIQSDEESSAQLMSDDDDVLRDSAAITTRGSPTRPSLGDCDAPRDESTRLPSMASSPSQRYTQRESQTRMWIRETPFDDRTPSEGPSHFDNHDQRPRQTARISGIQETPDVDTRQAFLMSYRKAVGVASIKSRATQTSPTQSAKTPERQFMVAKATQTSPKSPMQPFRTSTARSRVSPDSVQRQISNVARAQNSGQRQAGIEASKSLFKVGSVIENSNRKNQEGKAEGQACSRRTQVGKQVARGRSLPTGSVDAEMAGNEGRLGRTKQRVQNMLSNALMNAPSDPLTRDSPGAAKSRPRERSFSSQTRAFNAAIQQGRLEKQDAGPLRSEMRGDLSRYYAKGLVTMAKEYSEPSQNHPYRHRPETSYGFSLSSESLVMQSIEP